MIQDLMRVSSLNIDENYLKSGLYGKTNYSRPLMVKVLLLDHRGKRLTKVFSEVTRKLWLTRLPWILVYIQFEISTKNLWK